MSSTFKRTGMAIAMLAALTRPAVAEDIDLYGGGASAGKPNVLFFLDNSSNWSANNQAWDYSSVYATCASKYKSNADTLATCQRYVNQIFNNGSDSSLVQGQVEVRALKLVLNELVCSPPGTTKALSLNAGVMMFTSGSVDSSSTITGYFRHAISDMAAQCGSSDPTKSIVADMTNIDAKITTPDFKGPSSAEYGAPLYEAFKYFGGWARPDQIKDSTLGAPASPQPTPWGATGFGPTRYSSLNPLEDSAAFTDSSKSTYQSPIGDSGCGKNFIILIGNTWPNQEDGTNQNVSPPTNTLMSRIGYAPDQIYLAKKSDIRFADEWAKFLYSTDVSKAPGVQNVQTYAINVFNKSVDLNQRKLLMSMAAVGRGSTSIDTGGGGYFEAGADLYALITAIKDILTQIASVNSVFASASLPVSVNAQGTFLNQVFMGVFRPDGNAYQRWPGNLKQYRFALNGNSIDLVDSVGSVAVDNSSGFIQNCATSFWTKDSGTYWQAVTPTKSACTTAPNFATSGGYSDLPDGPLVERGAAGEMLRSLGYASRNIRTCDSGCTKLVDFNTTNVTITNGLSTGTTSDTLVNWIRGQNTGDGTFDPATGTVSYTTYPTTDSSGNTTSPSTRPTVHGEVVHSRPLAVNYGSGTTADVVVFYGAGDGMLHAIDGSQTSTNGGNEVWAFIAPEHWNGLTSTWNLMDRVRTNNPLISYPNVSITGASPKTYFFDGSIGGYQEMNKGTLSKLWIYPTMRRGGRVVYAFDVSSKPSSTNQPKLLWKFGPSDNAAIGQTWSTPLAIRVAGQSAPLVVFGAGYDPCEDGAVTACDTVSTGRGLFVMDAQQGKTSNFRFIDPGTGAGRFVADIVAVDANGDGYVDVLYAVDTRGNVWRINTSDPTKNFTGYANGVNGWQINKIATVSDWTTASERRKFMSAPSVVMLGTQATILVGTGDREKPLNTDPAAAVNNRFYGMRDDITNTSVATTSVIKGYGPDSSITQLTNVTNAQTPVDPTTLAAGGWYMNLSTTSTPFEQVVTTPLTIGGRTHFSTYQAATPGSTQCTNLGTARAYTVDFQTGVMSPNSIGNIAPDTFVSQGIPPSPVGGVVSIDGKTVPFCIGCSAPTVLTPSLVKPVVKANRKPIYRTQRID
ncbi:MAG TPA: PilC/PilY family type IV pilus protein [Burkholderiaceae bacterium]|nr:PilC/PilY family type IV pilus protein [Burkholderiaceae bacterium]